MSLWIYQGGRFPFSLELPLIYRTKDNSLKFFAPPQFSERYWNFVIWRLSKRPGSKDLAIKCSTDIH